MEEFKTEQRISNLMKELGFSGDEARSVYYAFDKLLVFKKEFPASYIAKNLFNYQVDCAGEQIYIAKMRWINEFMRSKGFTEDIFRDVTDFDTCLDDYDYYYAYKTPTQYRLDEEARRKGKS